MSVARKSAENMPIPHARGGYVETIAVPHYLCARTRAGTGQTTKDLSEHPWSGVDVTMTLVARDEGNNEGRSNPQEMRLPERPFSKPLPRALIVRSR